MYWPLDVATINMNVDGVTDLFGVSADLVYPGAVVTFDDGSLAAGSFLDDGSTILIEQDDDLGTLSWGVTRTSATGASGSGTVATVTFSVADFAKPGIVKFSQKDIAAVDPAGNPITLTDAGSSSFVLGGVWPGDADNNCTVEGADLLPLGLNFGDTGPARAAYDLSWSAKAFSPWGSSGASSYSSGSVVDTGGDFSDSFVDTDGDGEIDEGDVLAIGVNYAETHGESTGCDDGAPKTETALTWRLGALPAGSTVTLTLELTQAQADLLGTAFKLTVDPSLLKVEMVEAGSFLDNDDLLAFVRLDDQTGAGEAAFTRKGEATAIQSAGVLSTIRLTVLKEEAAELSLSDIKLSSVSNGVVGAGSGVVLREARVTANESANDLPEAFTLHSAYPNPFNPQTTMAFDMPEAANVRLVVYDVLGRQVRVLVDGLRAAGTHEVTFEASNLPSGMYLVRLETSAGRFTKTIQLVK